MYSKLSAKNNLYLLRIFNFATSMHQFVLVYFGEYKTCFLIPLWRGERQKGCFNKKNAMSNRL